MEQANPVFEFETEITPGGTLNLPPGIAQRLGTGKTVVVRISEGSIPANLRRRKVSEADVEAIAAAQFEQRANVIAFLSTEGALRNNASFRKRVKKLTGQFR